MTLPGLYRGIVVANTDGDNKLTIRIPSVVGDLAIPGVPACLPPGWNGTLLKPGDGVWVMFESGNPDFPVWLGSWNPEVTE